MSFSQIYCRAKLGIEAPEVVIEVHISHGLPGFQIVGLAETSVREARDRVRSAIINSQFKFPQSKITVNLAPADLKKEGGRFDLPIAIGILAATGQFDDTQLQTYEFYGELGLQGDIRPILGEIPSAIQCANANRICVMPPENVMQAKIVSRLRLLECETLLKLFHQLKPHATPSGRKQTSKANSVKPANTVIQASFKTADTPRPERAKQPDQIDLDDVIGQPMAKRALALAAAGSHNLLFVGPPGTGKSMLAQRMTTILPEMTEQEALETAAVKSISGHLITADNLYIRPFRAPHHTCSGVALVGGGTTPKPGEISLSHNGVLFLDELPEFERRVLDVLREPMETGKVCISRASQQAEFPARFQLLAALNPSPTGSIDDGRMSNDQILKYLNKISGPFLDRIDLQIDVPLLPKGALLQNQTDTECSADVKIRVNRARKRMMMRQGKANALLNNQELTQHCLLAKADALFLEETLSKLNMSIRAYHRIVKVARTIADYSDSDNIKRSHLTEALSYRALERLIQQVSR